MRLYLEFASAHSEVHRSRLQHAFRVFCAIYGHQPLSDDDAASADLCLSYAEQATRHTGKILRLMSAYVPRSPQIPAPEPIRFCNRGLSTALFYAAPSTACHDWLAEIFEWISVADEYSVHGRDSVGRVPFPFSYIGRHSLDPALPYAAIAMRLLQFEICRRIEGCPVEPLSPVPSARHFTVNTHDVDFLPLNRLGSVARLFKNACISLLEKRLFDALSQVVAAIQLVVGGTDPLNQLSRLATAEYRDNLHSSYYFLCRHNHRRDANYRIDNTDVVRLMRWLQELGSEIGLHGSYTSLDDPQGLSSELSRLAGLGFRAYGGRQHWLRFTLARLIPAVERSRVAYDASMGWPDVMGFRAGACFAFPPYDFEHERGATFLELPLVVMDQCVPVSSADRGLPHQLNKILSVSRHMGWGGISILWHPLAFGGGQLPEATGNIFWNIIAEGKRQNHSFVSALDFLRLTWNRYVQAGLLPMRAFN